MECSATGAELPEVTAVDAVSAPDAAVDAGKLILVDDGRRVILGRAVTSKVTLQKGEPAALKKIKLVGALDLIRHYAITTVEDHHRHTIISNLADPDNPRNQRIVAKGVSFDDVTLADWEAAKLGTIDAPFTADSVEILDT